MYQRELYYLHLVRIHYFKDATFLYQFETLCRLVVS
jgi:hypothetical protein